MTSWKVMKDGNVVFEGPIDLVIAHLKKLGDNIRLDVFIEESEISIVESKFKINRSELIKRGMKQRQLEEFRKYKGFINDPGYKFCTLCKRSKPLDAFGFRSDSDDGRARQCKDCVNKRARKRRRKVIE